MGNGSVVDLVLLFFAVIFGLSGVRQGLVVGLFAFAGFLLGGLIGTQLAPIAVAKVQASGPRAVVAVIVVFAAAALGQVVAVTVGRVIRARVRRGPGRNIDVIGGGVVSILAMLLVAWMVATPLANAPFPWLSRQIHDSIVIKGVNSAMPTVVRRTYGSFQQALGRGGFATVFGSVVPNTVDPVAAPDPASARTAGVRAARDSIVKIVGTAPSCSRRLEGSGFVYAHDRVMTNAHVVAGVRNPTVDIGGRVVPATVVVYDPELDIAVLAVRNIGRAPLLFDGSTKRGENAAVAGYPLDGPFEAVPARVSQRQLVRGPDIYNRHTVQREVYAIRARVRNGNSGGPLLSTQGKVIGVVFAAAADDLDSGFALTAHAVESDAAAGARLPRPVSTQGCD